MAVTFAVGAVTGTVLTFEFGLLWPRFMGQWGEAFGVPFAFEGLFFFTEAIFIAIYIYGWRRLKPWPHFWTGVPVVDRRDRRQRVGGGRERVDERAVGLHAELGGQGRRRRPVGGDLQRRDAARWPRTWWSRRTSSAGSSSPRCTRSGMLRGPARPLPPARVHHPVHRRGDRDRRSRWRVGDSLARWVYNNEPTKFAAIELVPKTSSDVPETLLGHLNSDGTVTGGIPIPGLASFLSDPADGKTTVGRRGSTPCPPSQRADDREVNIVHLAWDVMVGLGTLLFLLVAVVRACWIFRRDMPKQQAVPAARHRCAGVAAVITLEAGWVVSEVGRQPWIVYNLMKVEDAATAQHRRVGHVPRCRRAVHRAGGHHDPGPAQDEPAVPRAGGRRPTTRRDRRARTGRTSRSPIGRRRPAVR